MSVKEIAEELRNLSVALGETEVELYLENLKPNFLIPEDKLKVLKLFRDGTPFKTVKGVIKKINLKRWEEQAKENEEKLKQQGEELLKAKENEEKLKQQAEELLKAKENEEKLKQQAKEELEKVEKKLLKFRFGKMAMVPACNLESPSNLAVFSQRTKSNLEKNNIYILDLLGIEPGIEEIPTLLFEEFANFKNDLLRLEFSEDEPSCVQLILRHMETFYKFHRDENELVSSFYALLNDLIDHYGNSDYQWEIHRGRQCSKTKSNIKSDICLTEKMDDYSDIPLLLIETKRAQGITKTCPRVQIAAYYAHHFAYAVGEDQIASSGWPTLLITQVQGVFTFMAAYTIIRPENYNNNNNKEDAVGEIVGNKCYHLIQTLGTVNVCIRNDLEIVAKMFDLLFGYLPKFQKLRKHCNLLYPNILPPDEYRFYPNKLVYFSTTTKTVYKFTKQYCVDAHTYAHSLGIAPLLKSFRKLPSNYYFVEMELLDRINREDDYFDTDQWNKFCNQMKSFNAQFVHGDIRKDNIIHNERGYFLVDFDWSGYIADEPKYPDTRNHLDITWHADSFAGGVITPAHDIFMLEELEKKLKNNNNNAVP